MLPPAVRCGLFFCLMVVSIFVKPIKSVAEVETHTRLYRSLLKNYEKGVPPLTGNTSINLMIGYSLRNIIEVNVKDEILVTSSYFYLSWKDARLSWNESDYDNITHISMDLRQIWRPDLVIYNSADPAPKVIQDIDLNGLIGSTGKITHVQMPTIRTFCQMDLSRFPYDTQTCGMIMGSWTYSDTVLHLTKMPMEISKSNTEWEILAFTDNITVKTYQCCPEGYPEYRLNMTLQRKPGLYGYMFISPAVLFSLLTPIIFLTPPSSGERTTLGSVLLLCLVALLQMLDNHLPPQQVAPPLIGLYYTCTMVFVSVALGLSAFIANIKSRGNRQNGVPLLLRKIFLGPIKSLVFMDRENFRPFNNMTPGGERSLAAGAATDLTRKMGDNPTALERQLGDLIRQLSSITYIREREQIINTIVSDWQDLVLVLDRIFFILFLLLNIIITMAFLI